MNKKWLFTLLACGLVYTTGCTQTNQATPVAGASSTPTVQSETVVVWKQVQNPAQGEEQLQKELHEEQVIENPADIAARLIELLKMQQDGSDLLPTIPSEIQLLGAEFQNKTLTLNFNDAVSKLQGDAEQIFIKSVNYSLVQNFSRKTETEFKTLVYQINGQPVKTLVDGEFGCNKGELCFEPFLSQAKTN